MGRVMKKRQQAGRDGFARSLRVLVSVGDFHACQQRKIVALAGSSLRERAARKCLCAIAAEQALHDWFSSLNGHRPAQLYDMVLREVEVVVVQGGARLRRGPPEPRGRYSRYQLRDAAQKLR